MQLIYSDDSIAILVNHSKHFRQVPCFILWGRKGRGGGGGYMRITPLIYITTCLLGWHNNPYPIPLSFFAASSIETILTIVLAVTP